MPTRGGAAKRAPFVGQCALPGRGLIPSFHCTRLAGTQAGSGESAVHSRRGDAQTMIESLVTVQCMLSRARAQRLAGSRTMLGISTFGGASLKALNCAACQPCSREKLSPTPPAISAFAPLSRLGILPEFRALRMVSNASFRSVDPAPVRTLWCCQSPR
jgi:hypothetical protein